MADDKPMVCLFGHSFVKRLASRSTHRGESLLQTLGLGAMCELFSYGQGGLSYHRILSNPGGYMQHILACGRQPDLLIVDVGSNDLGPVDTSVAEVVDNALRFLGVLDCYNVSPKVVVFLSVVQRTSIGNHGGVSLNTYNHRVKSFNSRLSTSILQQANVRMFSQTRVNLPKYVCEDGCHLTEEGQMRYGRGLRQAVLKFLPLC